jgi:hypothetical protein
MTHSVAASSNAAVARETGTVASAARTTGASFAEAHAAAVRDGEGKDTTTTASGSSSSDAPKGERTQKVPGHSYAEIISGPRNGMFINNTGGKRDGEAFLIVKRHGREFHIYGTGEDRAVYEVGRKRENAPSGSTGTTGTGTAPTAGTTGTGVSAPATTG